MIDEKVGELTHLKDFLAIDCRRDLELFGDADWRIATTGVG